MQQSKKTNELYHYGVLGMRWGVRRKSARQSSEDSSNVKNIRKKRVDEMSNKELIEANNRIQLERQYKSLTGGKAKRAVKAFVGTAGTITAVVSAAKVYKKIGEAALRKLGPLALKAVSP